MLPGQSSSKSGGGIAYQRYLVLYDRDSLTVSRKLSATVEEYIDDH